MRRMLTCLSLVLILALGISAVSAQDSVESVDPTGQTIVYWNQYQEKTPLGDTMASIIEDFNSTNEYKITVQGVPQGNYNDIDKLVNAGITSGELPNLVAGYANAAASYALDNSTVDLTPYMTSEKWGLGATPDINQGLVDADTVDGKVLAFPNQSSAQVFAYNSTLLSQVGIDAPPTTIDDFKTDACTVSKATGANGEDLQGFAITTDASAFESWVASMGGAIYHDGAFDFKSQPVMDTLQMYHDLFAEGCAYTPAEQYGDQTDFNNGVLPFYVTSSAGFSYVIGGFAKSGVTADWGISTFPHTDGNAIIQAFVPSIIMMPSTPEKQLASWLFLKYLATPDVAAKWSAGTGYFNPVPSTADALKTATFSVDGLGTYFNEANALISSPDIKVYSSPAIAAYSKVRALISTAIADVTSNGMAPADVAQTLQDGADQALADSAA
ncbi:MAG: extracellular solute-binding protein [Chloroflexi bacterium]|nr:extracellular solute-binding protein [Chloroflexota bacterium]